MLTRNIISLGNFTNNIQAQLWKDRGDLGGFHKLDSTRQLLLAVKKIVRKYSLNQFYWLDGQNRQANQLSNLTRNSDEKLTIPIIMINFIKCLFYISGK